MEQTGLDAGRPRSERGKGSGLVAETDTLLPRNVPAVPTVHDALVSARRALASARLHAEARAAAEAGVTVEEVLAALQAWLASLAPGRTLSTAAWFATDSPAEMQIALVLALLELARLGGLWVQRPPPTSEPQSTAVPRPLLGKQRSGRAPPTILSPRVDPS